MNIYNLAFLLLFQYPFTSSISDSHPKDDAGAANVIFKSTDGGETWHDISEGLPENLQADGFVEKNSKLYILVGNELYYSELNSAAPFWEKETFPNKHSSRAPDKVVDLLLSVGIFAYNYDGQFFQRISGTSSVWSDKFTNFQEKEVYTFYESDGGEVFVGCEKGLFKSTDSGKTWKQVHNGGWVRKLMESNGVLMAVSQNGILRSDDDGETWDCVLNEGGVGIALESITGGFAAITANTRIMARTVRASYDGGKTWEPIDDGLPADLRIASIIQVGENFFCGHPAGVFRSSDKGKTWKLLLPAIGDKVFNLSVSGNVIYAIPRSGGC